MPKITCENPEAVAQEAFWLAWKAFHADYVFGRMMKLMIQWDETSVTVNDTSPRHDYQSWCYQYTTYQGLIEAAIESLTKK